MKIYTRTGDKGQTSLFTGERVSKDDPFIHAIGTVDECNSTVGAALSFLPQTALFQELRQQLETIQHTLFDLGAALATPRTRAAANKIDRTRFDNEGTKLLEEWMDQMDTQLPPLHAFILPGGHPSAAMLHIARSTCRRAERLVVPLTLHADVSQSIMVYLNRLSDYLFVATRWLNQLSQTPETLWQHHKS